MDRKTSNILNIDKGTETGQEFLKPAYKTRMSK